MNSPRIRSKATGLTTHQHGVRKNLPIQRLSTRIYVASNGDNSWPVKCSMF